MPFFILLLKNVARSKGLYRSFAIYHHRFACLRISVNG
jgi:hypothetical protein